MHKGGSPSWAEERALASRGWMPSWPRSRARLTLSALAPGRVLRYSANACERCNNTPKSAWGPCQPWGQPQAAWIAGTRVRCGF